jgi:hypothetical protein
VEKKMMTRFASCAAGALLAAMSVAAAPVAVAQDNTVQTLDRTAVFNGTKVLETEFGDPNRTVDFTVLGIAPVTGFTHCQLTATRGLYCLDGKTVRNWPDPKLASGTGALVLSCTDTALGLDTNKSDTCAAMTVDQGGAIWIVGRKSNAYNLIKIVRKNPNNTCPEGTSLAQSANCARTYVTGRTLISDITPIDGDVAAAFTFGPGLLGIENQNSLVFYDDAAGTAPKVLGTKQSLGLSGNESLSTTTLLQFKIANVLRNFALVATSTGRILAVDTAAASPTGFLVFNAVTERTASTTPAVQCTTATQRYAIRASTKSSRVYLTDRDFCQALSLQPASATGKPFVLANTQEDGADLTFATTGYPPDGATVAAGIVVDLSTCGTSCALLTDPNGAPAAQLTNVSLVGSSTDLVLFQVKNIPDCRWIDPKPAVCNQPNVIVNPSDPPNAQYLNVTPLLPPDVTALFDSSGAPPTGLPRMLISPQYRGQEQNGFVFEAFFGFPTPGLQFNKVFGGEWDVTKLTGTELGCGLDTSEALKPNRKFDVSTTVSERYVTAGGPGSLTDASNPNRWVDTMVNTGCGSSKVQGVRWSLYTYNMEITPNTDAVFAKLLVSLYDDLEETRAELACKRADAPSGAAPMSASLCSTLRSTWLNGKDKLDKCISASTQPKQSSGSQNCTAFNSQLTNYRNSVINATAVGPDPANRVSEIKQRVDVIFEVFLKRFLPSIPVNGFTNQ